MYLKDAYRFTYEKLVKKFGENEAKGISSLIFSDFGYPRNHILNHPEDRFTDKEIDRLNIFIDELNQNKPLQYILGYSWFMDLKITVSPDVLIPRRETEELSDLIIKKHRHETPAILDIGTGSGCIALSLADNIDQSVVHASDNSFKALNIAVQNAKETNLKITFIQDDILSPDDKKYLDTYDIIVSNPPYVRESEKNYMQPNVLDYEPASALYVSDSDPLIFYRAIVNFASRHLKSNAFLYLEINEFLGNETLQLFNRKIFNDLQLIKDMQGKDRFIIAIKT